jgi:hypothetical protein
VTALSIPLFAFFTVVTVLFLSVALRRLMGMRLSPLRTLIAALIALFSASPIITVIAAILAVRVLVQVFRPSPQLPGRQSAGRRRVPGRGPGFRHSCPPDTPEI